jgi:hypothetical protein
VERIHDFPGLSAEKDRILAQKVVSKILAAKEEVCLNEFIS